MGQVKLTILKSNCRSGYHKQGEVFIVKDLCPAICHELWNNIYPSVYALLNGASLDFGDEKARKFMMACPDGGRVVVSGEFIEE